MKDSDMTKPSALDNFASTYLKRDAETEYSSEERMQRSLDYIAYTLTQIEIHLRPVTTAARNANEARESLVRATQDLSDAQKRLLAQF